MYNTIKGVNPPVPTFFDERGYIDYESNKTFADFLIEKGVNGLAYLGTTGEFSVLTTDEKKQFIKEMTKYINHRVNVIAGVGSTCLNETIGLAKAAQEYGVDAVLLVNPYFSVYEGRMVEAYYDAVAEAIELPIIIYNFPDLTGFNFNRELVEKLIVKHENIIGIKDTVADMQHIRSLIQLKDVRPDFRVFSAFENQGMGTLCDGVDGFINATCNFAPEFTVGLYNSFINGKFDEAVKYYEKMCDAMEIYSFSQPLFLACKQAVYERILHKECGERLPALPLEDEKKRKVHDTLRRLKLID